MLSGVVATANLAYVIVSGNQLNTMNAQLDNMNKTLALERPWLGIVQRAHNFNDANELVSIDVKFTNGGRSMATRVIPRLILTVGPPGVLYKSNLPTNPECNAKRNDTNGVILIPGGVENVTVPVEPKIRQMWRAIAAGRVNLYMVGCIDYSDASERPNYRTFVTEFFERSSNSGDKPGAGHFSAIPFGNGAY
jgi:hypothetical protein